MDFYEAITAVPKLSFHGEEITGYELIDDVKFVAIKNGRHDSRGFVAVDSKPPALINHEGSHAAFLHYCLLELFLQRGHSQPSCDWRNGPIWPVETRIIYIMLNLIPTAALDVLLESRMWNLTTAQLAPLLNCYR